MKKLIGLVLATALMLGMVSCSAEKPDRKKARKKKADVVIDNDEIKGKFDDKNISIDIDELKTNEGLMFYAGNGNAGLVCSMEDYWSGDSFYVYYDGKIEMSRTYNLSGTVTDECEISDEDYEKIYEFAYNAYINESFKDYEEDVCDGDTWYFKFSDSEGEHTIYSGYAYNNEEMNDIKDILDKYQDKVNLSPVIPQEGKMLEATILSQEPIDVSTDNLCGYKIIVNYDMTAEYYELYTLSEPLLVKTVDVDEYTFFSLREFCMYSKSADPFKDYSEDDVCDGDTWTFEYYEDADDEAFLIYDGYIYSHYQLSDVAEQLDGLVK